MTSGLVSRAWLEAAAAASTPTGDVSRAFIEAMGGATSPTADAGRAFLDVTARNVAAPCAIGRAFIEVVCSTVFFAPGGPVPTPSTSLSPFGIPRTKPPTIPPKALGGLPPIGFAIPDFDIWRPGYSGAIVEIMMAGTSQPAPVFYDILLTQPALNPQVLQSQTDADGVTYGSWLRPIYTYLPYYLLINETDTTGIVYPPLTTLDAVDASYATAASPRGGAAVQLRQWLNRRIHVQNFGPWGETLGSATNGATLAAAVGAAAAQGGGEVIIPAGTFPVISFTLPQGVVLSGQGLSATFLQCTTGGPVCTISGDGAGLRNMVLDGIVLAAGSFGVDTVNAKDIVFEHVLLQRFATGMRAKGGAGHIWHDFSISNCTTAADFRGDSDVAVTSAGGPFQNVQWTGGTVSLCTTNGLIFEVIDFGVDNIVLHGVQFSSNQCAAITFTGAHDCELNGCAWNSNSINWLLQDGTNAAYVAINTIRNVIIRGGQIIGGQVNGAQCNFSGTCLNVRVQDASLQNCAINLNAPQNQVTFQDCYLDATTTVAGTLTLYATLRTSDTAIATGVTVDASATTAWQLQLQPGQVAIADVQAIAKQENGINYGTFWEACGAAQPGATLNYSSGTAAFTVPAVLTGQISHAVALIRAKSGSTASGTLTLEDITGTFLVGEMITDNAGGSALTSGPVTPSATVLDATGQTDVRAPTVTGGSGYAVNFAVSGPMFQVQVVGASAHTVAWQIKVKVVVN